MQCTSDLLEQFQPSGYRYIFVAYCRPHTFRCWPLPLRRAANIHKAKKNPPISIHWHGRHLNSLHVPYRQFCNRSFDVVRTLPVRHLLVDIRNLASWTRLLHNHRGCLLDSSNLRRRHLPSHHEHRCGQVRPAVLLLRRCSCLRRWYCVSDLSRNRGQSQATGRSRVYSEALTADEREKK